MSRTAGAVVVTPDRLLPFPTVPTNPTRARSLRAVPLPLVVAVVGALVAGCGQGGREDGSDDSLPATSEDTTTSSAPGPDDLGDGAHEVLVESADRAGATVTVDGVQVLSGMDAVLAYLGDTDGAQLEGAQWYVRNANSDPQEFDVDTSGTFSVIRAEACCDLVAADWAEFATSASTDFANLWGRNPPFAATIEDSTITSLTQIYIP